MIKFFRSFRQKLLSENKFSKYLLYAIGEILLVVVGILIALQLNNNAEERKLDAKRQEYYSQLLVDLNKEILNFNDFRKSVESDHIVYNRYQDIYKNGHLKPNEVYEELAKLRMYSNVITFNSSTIESLRSSGELILFPLEIRNKLMDLLRIQALIQRGTEENNGGKNNLLMHLGRIRGASSLLENLEGHLALKDYLKFDENLPDIILGLDAVHKWKNLSETITLEYLEKMQKDIEHIILLIQEELSEFSK